MIEPLLADNGKGDNSLKRRILLGLGWSGLAQVLRQALQIGTSILLARLLVPSDFGLLAMVLVFAGFASSISDLGLSAALVQRQDIQPQHKSTIFCLQLAFGSILTILLLVTAPLIARFYETPRLTVICFGIAPTFLLNAFGGVPLALLQRRMAFRSIAAIEAASILVSGTTAIILALNGWGIWSLVIQAMLASFITAIFSWQQSRWKLSLYFSIAAWRELRNFSSALTGFNTINYWVRNLDNLIIGKFIGATALGLYTRAYSMMLFPITQISGTFSRVMFPAMASIQDQTERLREIYIRATRTIALVTFPLMTGMGVLADTLILVLFGPAWNAAASILRILAVVGLLQSVGTTVGWIYTARGRTDIMFYYILGAGGVYAAAFLIGLRWGVPGIAIAYAVCNVLLLWYPSWTLAGHLIGLTFLRMVANLAGIFACSAGMGVVVFILQHFVFKSPGWISLLALVGSGTTVYLAMVHLCRLSAYLDLLKLLREQLAFKRCSD
jgi:O-antigen/teichoic acid export membrane protein